MLVDSSQTLGDLASASAVEKSHLRRLLAECRGSPMAGSEERNFSGGFLAPNLAGPMSAACPLRSVRLPHSCRSIRLRFCKMGFYEAAVGDLRNDSASADLGRTVKLGRQTIRTCRANCTHVKLLWVTPIPLQHFEMQTTIRGSHPSHQIQYLPHVQ